MRPIGTPPPRNKATDRLKAEIWAEQCSRLNKPSVPGSVMNDQLGPAFYQTPERGYFDCCRCGEPYKLIPGKPIPPLIHDGKYEDFWCESCIREYANELLGGEKGGVE